jgi:carbonic anhydrase/acetyltransferase-like protein (isoleucine patch superfamily)
LFLVNSRRAIFDLFLTSVLGLFTRWACWVASESPVFVFESRITTTAGKRTLNITHHPELICPTVYVAPNAIIVGEVHVADEASIWFGCVLRGDDAPITIGARTNVQDLAVIHVDADEPCALGEGVTVGHRAVLHSAIVEHGALVGIGAIVLNGAVVGQEALVGAGTLVPPGMAIPSRHLALGAPAQVVRELTEEEIERQRLGVARYVKRARAFMRAGEEIGYVTY